MHGDFLVVKQMPIMCSTFLHKAGVFFLFDLLSFTVATVAYELFST